MRIIYFPVLVGLYFIFPQKAISQPDIVLTQITSVNQPVDITGAGDNSGRLFIVDKSGKIRIYNQNTNTLLSGNFLDITTQVSNSGERGLLGLAFHPQFASNGYFYVNYIHTGTFNTTISRFTASPPSSNTVSSSTELVLLDIPQPFSNHNGGDLAFGPDGYLYVGMGDGGSASDPGNRAQNPQELLGKMLRIDVDNPSGGNNYGIPPSNPFVGVQTPVDYLDEIWAVGMRNPWRFSFDRNTGDLWIADVGQGAWEEVDFQPAASSGGENYGWRCYEGDHPHVTTGCAPQSTYDGPIFEYPHNPSTGGNSITGGFVYRGTQFPSLQGWYIMADYTSDNFWLLQPNGSGGANSDLQPNVPVVDIVSFGEDDAGEMFASSLGGQVYKISVVPLPITLSTFNGIFKDEKVLLNWTTETERASDYFEVERKTKGTEFQSIGKVTAAGESLTPLSYQFEDPGAWPGENTYRLKMVDRDNAFKYSPAVAVWVEEAGNWQLFPNPAGNKVSLLIESYNGAGQFLFEITDMQGKKMLSFEASEPQMPFRKEFNIKHLPKGLYLCRLSHGEKTEIRRLVIR